MREILFRGKRTYNGEWVYGYLGYSGGDEDNSGEFLIEDVGGWYSNEVDPETVGQYTGLRDRNGKKIFEGDILFCGTWTCKWWAVCYKDDSFLCKQEGVDWYEPLCDIVAGADRVIGNIHDNPEFLEE